MTLDGAHGTKAVFLGEIAHKVGIKARLDARRALRRGPRHRQTRYRPPRFQNRTRKAGWLPPSLEARVDQTLHAVGQMRAKAPITAIGVEHVRFDTQQMQDPEITGIEYQQGTLWGYEVREYLLEKFQHQCVYCGGASDDPELNVEHVVPKNPKHGPKGTDRVSNLTIACKTCNDAKGNWQPDEWLAHLQTSCKRLDRIRADRLPQALAQLQRPLRDTAMMNATRWRLYDQLKATRLPVEGGSGGRTKKQRIDHGFPKEHYFDALCVGESTPNRFTAISSYVQVWTAQGRGTRRMCGTNLYGFPIRHRSRQKA